MKLQVFNGGKNTYIAPHLIGVNECISVINVNSESGSLIPYKKKLDAGVGITAWSHYFNAVSLWVTSAFERSYVEYRNLLYITEDELGTTPQKTSDGVTFYQLGITNPVSAITAATGAPGVLTGTYQYLVTYYNSAEGVESGPSPLSVEVVAAADQIDLSGIPVSADPQVDQKRIYRLGGNLTSFTLVTTITNVTVTYTDNIADTAVEGTLLESTLYQPAPAGLKFLIEHYGILIGAVGDKVYFTPVNRPNAWPTLNYIDFDSDVTGIGKVYNGIVVCTDQKSYIITGTNVNSFVKNTLSEFQGCKNHYTMKRMSSGELLWVSSDGICSSKGSQITVISRHKIGKQTILSRNAVVYDEVYYVQKTDDTVLVVDTRDNGLKITELNADTYSLIVANDIFYAVKDNRLYQMFASLTDESITWVSAEITEGSYTELKTYKSVFVRSEGTGTIQIILDGVVRVTGSLSGIATTEHKVPQDYQQAYSIKFIITGQVKVKEIEFKPLGRKSD